MRLLVTGHRRYIASHLIELLREHGYAVTGCDLNLFKGGEWKPVAPAVRKLIKHVRELDEHDLDGHDRVIGATWHDIADYYRALFS